MFDDLRPDWDSYFLALALVVSQRSLDPNTKHGCVIINDDRAILSTGYNGPPRGCNDNLIPLTSPEKYPFMAHAETNAISNAAMTGTALKYSTFYITGHPCSVCFRSIINAGAKKVIYGPIEAVCVDDVEKGYVDIMLDGNNIELVEWGKDIREIVDIFNNVLLYMVEKKVIKLKKVPSKTEKMFYNI